MEKWVASLLENTDLAGWILFVPSGVVNVVTTTPLWVANTRLKLQGIQKHADKSRLEHCTDGDNLSRGETVTEAQGRIPPQRYSGLRGKIGGRPQCWHYYLCGFMKVMCCSLPVSGSSNTLQAVMGVWARPHSCLQWVSFGVICSRLHCTDSTLWRFGSTLEWGGTISSSGYKPSCAVHVLWSIQETCRESQQEKGQAMLCNWIIGCVCVGGVGCVPFLPHFLMYHSEENWLRSWFI